MSLQDALLQARRQRKRRKRVNKRKRYCSANLGSQSGKPSSRLNSCGDKIRLYQLKHDAELIRTRWHIPLLDFLRQQKFVLDEGPERIIVIPKTFCLHHNYVQTIRVLGRIAESVADPSINKTELNFSTCTFVDPASLFLIQVLRAEITATAISFNKRLQAKKINTDVIIVESTDRAVNLKLLLAGLVPEAKALNDDSIQPISTAGFLWGNRKQAKYSENRKGKVTAQLVRYVEECLAKHGCMFLPAGRNEMDGLITEILNNGEDHSEHHTWYATANFSSHHHRQGDSSSIIGELNLCFLNFGYSIYDGFEKTKMLNAQMYDELDQKVKDAVSRFNLPHCTRENLFVLYALQEGVSRLKYQQPSRGNGTMKFLRAFLEIGDYANNDTNTNPLLSIFSGKTKLITDNRLKPYRKIIPGDINNNYVDLDYYFISLNPEEDMRKPPEASHIQTLKANFPGTLLSVKVFLNEQHLISKIDRQHGTQPKTV